MTGTRPGPGAGVLDAAGSESAEHSRSTSNAAPDGRLGPAQAAIALAVPPVTLRGAILHAQRLLNVEGYPVLRVDADGATVIVDRPLLREQFGLGP